MTSSCFVTIQRTRHASLHSKASLHIHMRNIFPRNILTPSCCKLNTSSDSSNSSKKSRRPPRPPTPGPSELPILDASPFLDSTLYIKKSSKASHTIGGIDATKRLLTGQKQVRSWIWRKDEETCRQGIGGRPKGVEFGLVGHGVPCQLLQDHVDTAWELLNDLERINTPKGTTTDEKQVVECDFYNGNGWLDFDWIKVHLRDGEKLNYPTQHSSSHGITSNSKPLQINSHHIKLYLTVMRRMSNVFGSILISGKDNNSTSGHDIQINPDKYWKKDVPTPMQHWRATIKRGFIYPPSVTGPFRQYDVTLGWTGPPIVELFPGKCGDDLMASVPSFVRITLQGIPTVFWGKNKEDDGEEGDVTNRDDMVPVSLAFEACFEQLRDIMEKKDE